MKRQLAAFLLLLSCATQSPEQPSKLPNPEEVPVKTPSPMTTSTPQKSAPSKPIPVGKAALPKSSLIIFSKPQARRVAVGDPLGIVLHWETTTGYPTREAFPNEWSLQKTFESMKFIVTMPDGTTAPAYTTWKDTISPRYDYGFYYQPTLFIKLGDAGLWDSRGFDGSWVSTRPSFSKEGVYKIQVEGALHFKTGDPVSFTSPIVEVEVSKSAPKLADIENKVNEEREKQKLKDETERAMPPGKWANRGDSTESGFSPGLLLEDDAGNLFIRNALLTGGFGYALHTTNFANDGTFISHEVKAVSTCIAEGTLVSTERGDVPIEELQVGEKIWSFDLEKEERVLSEILEIQEASSERFVSFGGLTVTPEHPIYAGGKWQAAGDLSSTERLLSLEGFVQAEPLFFSSTPLRVFDVNVATTHNFFAGGVLVHNKDRNYQEWLDDPWLFMWHPTRPVK